MDRLEEIEAAIEDLPPEQYRRFSLWFRELEQARWDKQLDADSAGGKLDFLFEEGVSESSQGLLRDWPPEK